MLTSAPCYGLHSMHRSAVCGHLVVWHWKVEIGEVLISSEAFIVSISLFHVHETLLQTFIYSQ